MQSEQRHEVHGGEGDSRDAVEVCAVGRVEPERAASSHRTGRVHPLDVSTAVLIRLDLDQRGLGRPAIRGMTHECGSASFR